MNRILTVVFIIAYTISLLGQSQTPTREFRGVWIASVKNIDYPSSPNLSEKEQKAEWIELMDYYEALNFNAIIAQIRPAGDAFYPSKLCPWSKYLTGQQGKAPAYDPLKFMIEETQKRGMEFHAWLNPYRASNSLDTKALDEMHPVFHEPDWMIPYGGKLYFNPGIPAVQAYITEVVGEILMNYDVDAIHFDDYFYPYPTGGETFNDTLAFKKHGYQFFNIEDWRRNNVDEMIKLVSRKIKNIAPHVKFGISPFGVWRNGDLDPENGSLTRAGVTAYDDLYANTLKWLEEEWIDYVVPQLYWHIGNFAADHAHLVDWWSRHHFDRHLYIGHSYYKVANDKEMAWSQANEIPKQIMLGRDSGEVLGSAYFNSTSIRKNPLGVTDSLSTRYYQYPALLPRVNFMEMPRPSIPIFEPIKWRKEKAELTWYFPDELHLPHYCVVYRFEGTQPGDFTQPENIFAIVAQKEKKKWSFKDTKTEAGKAYTYVITGVNRVHEESDLSNWRAIERIGKKVKKVK